jgi:hypothetical protein
MAPKVDGALHPELISDQEAITVFFVSTATPHNATPQDLRRLDARIRRMGLNESDRAMTIRYIQEFYDNFMPYKNSAATLAAQIHASPDPVLTQRRTAVVLSVEALTARTFGSLAASLSPDGALRLRNHIAYLKTRMKIVAAPPMQAGQ